MSLGLGILLFCAICLIVMTPLARFTTRKVSSWFRGGVPLWRASALSLAGWIAFHAVGETINVFDGDEPVSLGAIMGLWLVAHGLAFLWLKRGASAEALL